MSFCVNCCRVLLVFLSLLFLAAGLSLLCLTLWVRLDVRVEPQLRQTLLSDPALAPADLADIKVAFRLAYDTAFWLLVGLCSALVLIGLFGMCEACSRSRLVNGFLCALLVVAICLELVLLFSVALFRDAIRDVVDRYVSISFQYNLPDAAFLSTRFACCGDSNYQQPYNYQCQGLGKPNCHQVLLNDWLAIGLAGLTALCGGLVLAKLLATAMSGVLICNHKYASLDAVQ